MISFIYHQHFYSSVTYLTYTQNLQIIWNLKLYFLLCSTVIFTHPWNTIQIINLEEIIQIIGDINDCLLNYFTERNAHQTFTSATMTTKKLSVRKHYHSVCAFIRSSLLSFFFWDLTHTLSLISL